MRPDPRDADVVAAVDDITTSTIDAIEAWPMPRTDPKVAHLGKLVDRHGMFPVLAVAMGWAGHEVRHALNVACGTQVDAGRYTIAWHASAPSADVWDVVQRFLALSLAGDVTGLHDAAGLLGSSGAETARVLIATLDFCAALRERDVVIAEVGAR